MPPTRGLFSLSVAALAAYYVGARQGRQDGEDKGFKRAAAAFLVASSRGRA